MILPELVQVAAFADSMNAELLALTNLTFLGVCWDEFPLLLASN
jgi:hypothetical protein